MTQFYCLESKITKIGRYSKQNKTNVYNVVCHKTWTNEKIQKKLKHENAMKKMWYLWEHTRSMSFGNVWISVMDDVVM